MKTRYFFKVLGITIFSLFLLNSLGMAQIHYDSSGNVGIGTVGPTEKLDVAGTVKATSFVGDGSQLTGINGSGQWSEGTGGIYYNNGNVGIGTTAPEASLDVRGGYISVLDTANSIGSLTEGIALGRSAGDFGGGSQYGLVEGDALIRIGIGSLYSGKSGLLLGDDSTNSRGIIAMPNAGHGLLFGVKNDAGIPIRAMSINKDGNVGIGTTNPSSNAGMSRFLEISDLQHAGIVLTDTTAGAGWEIWNDEGRLKFYRKGTGFTLYLASSGNVGIGTTSPEYKLHVDGDIYATGTVYGASGTADTDWTERGGNVYRDSGNVGIGTTSPITKLDVNGTVTATAFSGDGSGLTGVIASSIAWPNITGKPAGFADNMDDVNDADADPGNEIQSLGISGNNITLSKGGGSIAVPYAANAATANNADKLDGKDSNEFGDGHSLDAADGSPVDAVYVANNGNVGIGTPEPQAKLNVVGGGIKVHFDDWGNSAIILKGQEEEYGFRPTYLGLDIYHHNSSKTLVSFNKSGNVGIGTTDPSQKLDVAGNIIANDYKYHSDARLKKSVTSIYNALDKVLALRGVEFEWRIEEYPEKGFDEGRKIGLIAQEVEQVIPEVVSTDNEGYKSVEYGNIVSVLIEAIKAQQAQIEELKARIELLEH